MPDPAPPETDGPSRPEAEPAPSTPSPETETAEELPQPFTGYEVTARIARGGMGEIYRARDHRFNREVAIKSLKPDLTGNPDAVGQFFNEARNVARLRHPNLVRGVDVGRTGEYFYFVMEYIRGETLAEKLERVGRGRLPEKETLAIVHGIGEALAYIAANGLVHRDIKPGNILLTAEREVKVCDLGVAREVAFPTVEAFVKGSPAYASPDQVRGDAEVDIRAEFSGLGCTWYHMLVGHPPFVGDTPQSVMEQHLHAPAPDPCSENPRLSEYTGELVVWLLHKDPMDRPPTPESFLAELQQHPLWPEVKPEESSAPQIQAGEADAPAAQTPAEDA